ncbi:MAG: gamma carbonic anhydrase family protein [Clostridium sp.]|uniref:gamma carbonic anhydrase family protein n=1 Tax=Clostridium sp. TaxID=1506 RepID=UPI0025BDA3CA|nr:gamma carbonic anhydrase family protein [Clostridium sp.]MCF0147141.1 gamma carbonic anhydrase family protein [Clostridium sp.]
MILDFKGIKPAIDKTCYISDSADIIGDVVIEKNANIWFGTTIRGDMSKIHIGENTNIQENSVVHVDFDCETNIGKNVTVGHRAIIHGCSIADNVLVGMGSIILNGAKIGKNSIIGAGSLVTQYKEFEEGVLIMGSPAKVVRKLTEEEIAHIEQSAINYVNISREYL